MQNQRKNVPRRQGFDVREQIPQINPVVQQKIGKKSLAVLVYQAGEDAASPNWDSPTQRVNTAVYKFALIVGSS